MKPLLICIVILFSALGVITIYSCFKRNQTKKENEKNRIDSVYYNLKRKNSVIPIIDVEIKNEKVLNVIPSHFAYTEDIV